MNPDGKFTFFVIRPLSDLFLWTWRLERRAEFLYRPQFDRWVRPLLFGLLQTLQNLLRKDEHLALAQETPLPDEEQSTQRGAEHPGHDRRAQPVHAGELAPRVCAAVRQH